MCRVRFSSGWLRAEPLAVYGSGLGIHALHSYLDMKAQADHLGAKKGERMARLCMYGLKGRGMTLALKPLRWLHICACNVLYILVFLLARHGWYSTGNSEGL
eukprot:scaffold38282_cov32-Prasinocladus_malaysianus.AAC.1